MKTRTLRLLALALLFVASLSSAPVSPELSSKIDRLFDAWNHPDTPGVIVAVARNGETIFQRAYGMANLEHAIRLTPETVTESGSVAKQFTAAAVALLAQRGKLTLDDPVRRHLPELPAALADKITVRMLLNHTSGLRDIHGLFDLMGRPSYRSFHDNAEVLRVMSRQQQLNFEPGTEYLYCNATYVLAAIIVQRVSGQSFDAFCEEHVFKPHGMAHTRWRSDFTALVPGRATGYAPKPGGGYRIDTPYSNIVGNGCLLFTAADLLKWNASLDEPTGEWAEVAKALQTRCTLNNGRPLNYGLGLVIDEYEGMKEIWHGGVTSGYRTFLARFPERHLSVVLLSNAGEFKYFAVSRQLLRLVLDLPAPAPASVTVDAATLAACAGIYHSASTDDLATLSAKNEKLFLDGSEELIPTGPGTFTNTSGHSTFVFATASAKGLTVTTANGVTAYAPVTASAPTASQLAAYAGIYRSEELEVARTVSVKNGRLVAEGWPAPAQELKPLFGDTFSFGRGWHGTFTRDASGAITGCELTNGRCRRVKFVRL